MTHSVSGLSLVAAVVALFMAAVPGIAQAGAVDELRSRGLGKYVDRYVEKDDKGNTKYKSSSRTSTTSAKAATKSKSKTAKKASSWKSKKKSTKRLARSKAKSGKKISKSSTKKKLTTAKKKYKVPSSVKNRLASYGISF